MMRIVGHSAGGLRVQLLGSTGQSFKIQRSADFKSWTDATDTLQLSGGMEVDIEADTNAALSFYRTIQAVE